jgi:hypothetical protein
MHSMEFCCRAQQARGRSALLRDQTEQLLLHLFLGLKGTSFHSGEKKGG